LAHQAFSAELRRFVRQNIFSVEQIGVLVLLSQQPERSWTTEAISAALSSSPHSIARRLAVLVRRQLVTRQANGEFQYAPNPRADRLVDELRAEYLARPVSLIGLLYAERGKALEVFSDAFLLGTDDNDR
jgi:hypothetical protein